MIVDRPLLLLLAPFVALLLAGLAWWARLRRIRRAASWSAPLAEVARQRGRWVPLWIGLAGLGLALALAGPRGGQATVRTESEALSVVFAIDVSRSMLAEDVVPSRLARAIRETRRLVQDLAGDRVGLIAFSGRSYILAPVTVDGRAVLLHLDALGPDVASSGGTTLSSALLQGGQLLAASSEVSDRVLVVFTDGESHDDLEASVSAARQVRDLGIRLVLVAEGSAEGTRIPIRDSAGTILEYKKDELGEVVITRVDERLLEAVTEAAEGTLVPAAATDQAGAVRDLMVAFKRSPTRETRAADLLPLGWIPALAVALVLLGQAAVRRAGSLIVLVLLAGVPATVHAQVEDPEAWLRTAERGVATDTAFYNAGSAALAAGRYDIAREALARAARSLDPELRYRALYNRGVAGLLAARADSAGRDSLMAEAEVDLKAALTIAPGSARAKWNLELARRRPSPPSGGGGGGPPPPQGGNDAAEPEPKPISAGQAEQLLNSVEREERRIRERQLKRLPGQGTSGAKDW